MISCCCSVTPGIMIHASNSSPSKSRNNIHVTSAYSQPKFIVRSWAKNFARPPAPKINISLDSQSNFPRLQFGRIASSFLVKRPAETTRGPHAPRASDDVPTTYRYPPMKKKPAWWWRGLACIPYILPLHEAWVFAEPAFLVHPFLETYEMMTYNFLLSLGFLPSWFLMAYFFAAYLGIVRRKEWPHFFRFHVIMGMLTEIGLQVIGMVHHILPQRLFWAKTGACFWGFLTFAYLFTVIQCMVCALCGHYADVPFACDAAYIQIPYD